MIDELDAVYIPPAVDCLTDEEDIDFENIRPENQPAEIAGTFELHNNSANGEDLYDSSDDETLFSKRQKLTIPTTSNEVAAAWVKDKLEYTHSPISREAAEIQKMKDKLAGKTPLDVFFCFFDKHVLQIIVDFSTKYARDNNRHDFTLSECDLLRFLGVVILSGYHSLPQIPLYWSTDEDKGVPIVKSCMTKNRFFNIKQNLHLSDNNLLEKYAGAVKFATNTLYINVKHAKFTYTLHVLSSFM